MHYARHITICLVAVWALLARNGEAAKSSVSPDVLTTFAKNVASVLSPALLGELQSSRPNRSSISLALTITKKPETKAPLATNFTSSRNLANHRSPESTTFHRHEDTSKNDHSNTAKRDSPEFRDPRPKAESTTEPARYRYTVREGPYEYTASYLGPGFSDYRNGADSSQRFLTDLKVKAKDTNGVATNGASRRVSQNFDQPIGSPGHDYLGSSLPKLSENNYQQLSSRYFRDPARLDSGSTPFSQFGSEHRASYPHQIHGLAEHPGYARGHEAPIGPIDQHAPAGLENAERLQNESPILTEHRQPQEGHPTFRDYDSYRPPGLPNHVDFPYPPHDPSDHTHGTQDAQRPQSVHENHYDGGELPIFRPLHGSFHLQGYPSSPFHLLQPERFSNVFNESTLANLPDPQSPFSQFPPHYNFYLPTRPGSAPPLPSSTPSSVDGTGNGEDKALPEQISASKPQAVVHSRATSNLYQGKRPSALPGYEGNIGRDFGGVPFIDDNDYRK